MNDQSLRELLQEVRAGTRPLEQALATLKNLPYEELGYARLDHHRALRQGFPEVILCEGKRVEHVVEIARHLASEHPVVMATRAGPEVFQRVRAEVATARYYPDARIIVIGEPRIDSDSAEPVLVVSAGTADVGVAEEAVVTAQTMGSHTERLYDVGVAGIHRLLDSRDQLDGAGVIIVVAGMDGALPSVVGGLVACPVIAVPTSVGYGTGLGGVAALMTMLNACSAGVAVVNIDNGFGAGYLAHLIQRQRCA